ncbi:MAG: ASKHA domain-containing protein [Fimbriimonadaceae bacterium]
MPLSETILALELPTGTETLSIGREQSRQTLSEILRQAGHPLNIRCGERDACGGCVVALLGGAIRHRSEGHTMAADRPTETDGLEFRACQYRPESRRLHLRVPQRSLLSYQPQVVGDYRVNVAAAHDPLFTGGLGVAVDVGTTTVVVQVVDPNSGAVVSRASAFNRQSALGDDVLTRINRCAVDSSAVDELQQAVVEHTVVPLVSEALESIGRTHSDVAGYSISGNSTMLHLFAGVDPSPMGTAPFTARFLGHEVLKGGVVGLEPSNAPVHLLPGASAYVGADVVAGAYVSGLAYDDGPSLLVDVGTNGEILLRDGAELLGCATAAGPAFEGSGLVSGVRAGVGAVSHIDMPGSPPRLEIEIIQMPDGAASVKPIGICGSAYVDFLAEGRRVGILGSTGRFDIDRASAAGMRPTKAEHGWMLEVARGQGGHSIRISEADVARLMQAKAAIAAGILSLLRRRNMTPADVRTVYLAGGFGMHMRLANAIGCGLLPGFREEQVQLVGNTSLGGATTALLDRNTVDELARLAESVEVVQLNLEPEFEDTYIEQLAIG